jgi:hypothetical protein
MPELPSARAQLQVLGRLQTRGRLTFVGRDISFSRRACGTPLPQRGYRPLFLSFHVNSGSERDKRGAAVAKNSSYALGVIASLSYGLEVGGPSAAKRGSTMSARRGRPKRAKQPTAAAVRSRAGGPAETPKLTLAAAPPAPIRSPASRPAPEEESEPQFSDIRALKRASEAPNATVEPTHSPLGRALALLRAGLLRDGMAALTDALPQATWPVPAQRESATLRVLATALPLLDVAAPADNAHAERADALHEAALALHADTSGLTPYVSALQLLAALQLGDPARIVRSAALASGMEHAIAAPWTMGFHVALRTALAQRFAQAPSMPLLRAFHQAFRAQTLADDGALARCLDGADSALDVSAGPVSIVQVLLGAFACDHHAKQGRVYVHARLAHLLCQASAECSNRHAPAIASIVDQRDIHAGSVSTRSASLERHAATLAEDQPYTGVWLARCEVERAKAERISGDAGSAFRRMRALTRTARQEAAWKAAHFQTLVSTELGASALAAAAEQADKSPFLQVARDMIRALPARSALSLEAGCAWQQGQHDQALRHLHSLASPAGKSHGFWPTHAARIALGHLRGSISDTLSAEAAARALQAAGMAIPHLAARVWLPGIPVA